MRLQNPSRQAGTTSSAEFELVAAARRQHICYGLGNQGTALGKQGGGQTLLRRTCRQAPALLQV